jgi:hypothetical protein
MVMAAHRHFNLSNWTPASAGAVAEGIRVYLPDYIYPTASSG